MKSQNPRVHFTDEERASPELKKPIRKAEKAADRVEQVRKKARLHFDEDAPKPPSKLTHEVQKAPGKLLSEEVHRNIKNAEDDNVGVEAAHGAEQTAETALHMGESAYHAAKLKPYRDVARAEQRLDRANVDVLHQKAMRDNPQSASNPISRHRQKEAIKRQYAAAKSGKTAQQTVKGAEKAAQSAADKVKRIAASFKKHAKAYLVLGVAGVMRPSRILCKPPRRCKIEAPKRRLSYGQERHTHTTGTTCRPEKAV